MHEGIRVEAETALFNGVTVSLSASKIDVGLQYLIGCCTHQVFCKIIIHNLMNELMI